METNIERLHAYILGKGLSYRAFEQSIGMSNGVIGRAISRKTDIASAWLSKIIDVYSDMNPIWLLSGVGNMLKKEPDLDKNETNSKLLDDENMNTHFESKKNIRVPKDEKGQLDINAIEKNFKAAEAMITIQDKIFKMNGLTKPHSNIIGIYSDLQICSDLVTYYALSSKVKNAVEKHHSGDLSLDDVKKAISEYAPVLRSLNLEIMPYQLIISELCDKLREFDETHDRIYCIDTEE